MRFRQRCVSPGDLFDQLQRLLEHPVHARDEAAGRMKGLPEEHDQWLRDRGQCDHGLHEFRDRRTAAFTGRTLRLQLRLNSHGTTIQHLKADEKIHTVLVISDSHLFGTREKELFRANTHRELRRLTDHLRSACKHFDLLVASGDLSGDGDPASYGEFNALTAELGDRMVWMKGNHDDFSVLPKLLAGFASIRDLDVGRWSMIFLDTTLPGKDEGYLQQTELLRLKQFLERRQGRHLLVFLHHQPVDVGTRFIDEIGLANKEDFWNLVGGNSSVRAVLFGHVHQVFEDEFKGIRLFSIPSSGIQFKPGSDDLAFDEPWTGCRTLNLFPNGKMETTIIHL